MKYLFLGIVLVIGLVLTWFVCRYDECDIYEKYHFTDKENDD